MALFDRLSVGARLEIGIGVAVRLWSIWVASAVIGGALAAIIHQAFLHTPDRYPDFIVGVTAIAGSGKIEDYAPLVGFGLGAAGFFLLLASLCGALLQRVSASAIEDVHRLFIIAVLPTIAWLGSLLLSTGTHFELLKCSVFLVVASTLGIILFLARAGSWWDDRARTHLGPILEGVMLVPAGTMLSTLAVAMVGNRLAILFGPPWFRNASTLIHWEMATIASMSIAVLVTVARGRTSAEAIGGLRKLLIFVQFFLPGLFLVVLPLPVDFGIHRFYGTPIEPATWAVLAALTLLTWVDLRRLARQSDMDGAPKNVVSALSLVAILIFFREPTPAGLPTLPPDDYHWGELLVPWWSWSKHGLLPLWDFTPPRGLINYAEGLFGFLFSNETLVGIEAAAPFHTAALILIAFFSLALIVGRWSAFLVLTVASLRLVDSEIDVLMTAALCALGYAGTRLTHTGWLATWIMISVIAVLVAAGQGGLLVLATAPAGACSLYQAWRYERRRLIRIAGVLAIVSIGLALGSPLGLMIAGAVRYGAEQSAVNSVANAVPWALGIAAGYPGINPWLFQIIRFSWIGVGAGAIVVTAWALVASSCPHRRQLMFFGSAFALLCLLFVVRAAGRIDLGYMSRPGLASVWAVAFMVPILSVLLLRGTRQLTALVVTTLAVTSFGPEFNNVATFDAGWSFPLTSHSQSPPAAMTDGPALGMQNLGVVVADEAHVKRLVTIKRQLDMLIEPTETYVDVTNRNAQYFYFDRPPPFEVSAFYNLITSEQQLRAVLAAERRQIPVALTGADNLLMDGLPASIRAPLLYRYLLLNFVPITLDGYDFMLRPTRLSRVGLPLAKPDAPNETGLRILDRDFRLPSLAMIPVSWGRSHATLTQRMREVARIDTSNPIGMNAVEPIGAGTFQIFGTNPWVSFDLAAAHIRGRDAGLLRFDFACLGARATPTIEIYWAESGSNPDESKVIRFPATNGTLIVPLDAAPRWLLSQDLGILRFGVADPTPCTAYAIRNVILEQRMDVDDMNAELARGGNR